MDDPEAPIPPRGWHATAWRTPLVLRTAREGRRPVGAHHRAAPPPGAPPADHQRRTGRGPGTAEGRGGQSALPAPRSCARLLATRLAAAGQRPPGGRREPGAAAGRGLPAGRRRDGGGTRGAGRQQAGPGARAGGAGRRCPGDGPPPGRIQRRRPASRCPKHGWPPTPRAYGPRRGGPPPGHAGARKLTGACSPTCAPPWSLRPWPSAPGTNERPGRRWAEDGQAICIRAVATGATRYFVPFRTRMINPGPDMSATGAGRAGGPGGRLFPASLPHDPVVRQPAARPGAPGDRGWSATRSDYFSPLGVVPRCQEWGLLGLGAWTTSPAYPEAGFRCAAILDRGRPRPQMGRNGVVSAHLPWSHQRWLARFAPAAMHRPACVSSAPLRRQGAGILVSGTPVPLPDLRRHGPAGSAPVNRGQAAPGTHDLGGGPRPGQPLDLQEIRWIEALISRQEQAWESYFRGARDRRSPGRVRGLLLENPQETVRGIPRVAGAARHARARMWNGRGCRRQRLRRHRSAGWLPDYPAARGAG